MVSISESDPIKYRDDSGLEFGGGGGGCVLGFF